MKQTNQEYMETIEGTEFMWKNIGCVGVQGNTLVRGGEVILKVNDKNIKQVMSAYNMSEYGTDDMETIMKMEGF